MNEALISTCEVVKEYSNGPIVRALDQVSIEIPKGQFVAISGPSGSGKSTLLNIIGGMDFPTTGEVVVDDVEVNAISGDALADFRRQKIGFIFQLFHLLPGLSAHENVMLPLIPYRRTLAFDLGSRAHDLLETVGLLDRVDHRPGELSGGELQRVAIARALVNGPKIILADEPTGNLDSKSGAGIVSLLRRINDDLNVTILLVTHDASLARRADYVLNLKDGRIVDQ
jgi:putative ABC transport system ATP-binding protein